VSSRKARTVVKMLRKLTFHPFVSTSCFQNPFSGRETTAYAVVVNRHAEVVKLFFHLFPYLLKPSRSKRWMELMADREFYRRIRICSRQAQLFLRNAAMKIGRSDYRYLDVLVSIAHSQGIQISRWSGVKHWTSDFGCSIPLTVIVECCRLLGEPVIDHVPVEFAALLWLHGVIDYPCLISLRRTEPLLRLNELIDTRQSKPKVAATTLKGQIACVSLK
jgi:hypothetical protein